MNITSRKLHIVSLAVLLGVGTCGLSTAIHSNTPVSASVLARTFAQQRFVKQDQKLHVLHTAAPTVSLPANTQQSLNWAGYIDTPAGNTAYTSVSATWQVPNISTSRRDAVAAQWIGLGGVNTTDLLQMGTIEQMQNGQPTAQVFWEQLPALSQDVMTVPTGSIIKASIAEVSNSNTWNITFSATDPNGQTQTQTLPVTLDAAYAQGIGTSAEWISEDPSDANMRLYPLANSGKVQYSNALVDGQPIAASQNQVQPVAMTNNNGTVLVAPSQLSDSGDSFFTTVLNTNVARHRGNRETWYPVSVPNWLSTGLPSGWTFPVSPAFDSNSGSGSAWGWTWSWSWN
ncbi:MAG: G1 family endopeptidase [Peptococcaceae bacterium]|nr:G1 family endopeptidase [Peptococcaceae bacterium]